MALVYVSTPTEHDRSAVLGWLVEAEAANCLQVAGLLAAPSLAAFPLFLVARRESAIVGVATWTSPFNLVLAANTHPDAVTPLAGAAHTLHPEIPGVIGPPTLAGPFASAWTTIAGGEIRVRMGQRILAVRKVIPPSDVAGSLLMATAADRPLLAEWFQVFASEAMHLSPEPARLHGREMADAVGRTMEGFLWLDPEGTPVSVACAKSPTVRGIRIGPVYTPPEHRRRGYAAAVTAAASQHHLNEGRAFVCLYTDASNPTSNRVYEGIGYEFVTDSIELMVTR